MKTGKSLIVGLELGHRNKLLEQTAIGQHCFGASHEWNRPCELCECPVRKVLETSRKVIVPIIMKPNLGVGASKDWLGVLASPVRDSQGNSTQVAELIWDADDIS